MKCTKCGCEFAEGIFCPECGTKYNEKKARESEKLAAQKAEAERDLALAQAKVEQERLEKERIEQEAELLKQKNENIRLEQEIAAKKAEEEKAKAEQLSRTFNGQIYENIEEMQAAKRNYEEAELERKKLKKANNDALWCLILGIATWPLLMTLILWFPSIIGSIVLGVKALKAKTEKKGSVITGFAFDALFILITIVGIVIG